MSRGLVVIAHNELADPRRAGPAAEPHLIHEEIPIIEEVLRAAGWEPLALPVGADILGALGTPRGAAPPRRRQPLRRPARPQRPRDALRRRAGTARHSLHRRPAARARPLPRQGHDQADPAGARHPDRAVRPRRGRRTPPSKGCATRSSPNPPPRTAASGSPTRAWPGTRTLPAARSRRCSRATARCSSRSTSRAASSTSRSSATTRRACSPSRRSTSTGSRPGCRTSAATRPSGSRPTPATPGPSASAPPNSTDQLQDRIEHWSALAFRSLGLRDYARIDWRLSPTRGLMALEANPNPDISPTSGFLRSVRAAGMDYPAVHRTTGRGDAGAGPEGAIRLRIVPSPRLRQPCAGNRCMICQDRNVGYPCRQ